MIQARDNDDSVTVAVEEKSHNLNAFGRVKGLTDIVDQSIKEKEKSKKANGRKHTSL